MANVEGIGQIEDTRQQTRTLGQPDEWAESPLFKFEHDEERFKTLLENPYITPKKPGEMLAGYFHDIVRTREKDVNGNYNFYLKMKDVNGAPFRLYTHSQLRGIAARVEGNEIVEKRLTPGQYMKITYNGKVHSDKLDTEVLDHTVELGEVPSDS